MTDTALAEGTKNDAAVKPPFHSFHHPAIKCFDAEETRKFYEDVLGLPLNAAVVINDDGRGGDYYFMHIFFRMADGDFIAFFDKDTDIKPDLFKPLNDHDMRLGLRVDSKADLDAISQRLTNAGIDYRGPVEQGLTTSIFFRDPNHLNVEISAPVENHDEKLAQEQARAKSVLDSWMEKTAEKRVH